MTDVGPPIGPRWFQIMMPGLAIGSMDLVFAVAIWTHPGMSNAASLTTGLALLGATAAIFVGAGLWMGSRVGFRWRGWRDEEAKRSEAAKQLAEKTFAPIKEKVSALRRKTR